MSSTRVVNESINEILNRVFRKRLKSSSYSLFSKEFSSYE